ncbi:MAG: hypothetical protein N2317_05625 [Syntrophales bacterium]|nr:hypothetical protein [Syntrophales bacterium]
MSKRNKIVTAVILVLIFYLTPEAGQSDDTPLSRKTLQNIKSVALFIEDLQPNIQKYAKKAGISEEFLKRRITNRLNQAGIKVLEGDEWLKIPGRPFLYLNINTHETEKYWYAYDIKLELRQLAFLTANPKLQTAVTTWSLNVTGLANIGNIHHIQHDAFVLVDRFVAAYREANGLQ